MTATSLLTVIAGGFFGGVCRLFLARHLPPLWGTFVANVVACGLLGWASHSGVSPFFVSAGFCGALSTWSTMAREVGTLGPLKGAPYLGGTVAAGALAMWVGQLL